DGALNFDVTVRFLQVVRRAAASRQGDQLVEVDELHTGGERYTTWEEAVEREIAVAGASERQRAEIAIPAGREVEELSGGALIRSWHALQGEIEVAAMPAQVAGAWRISVEIRNTTPFGGDSRQDALAYTFCSTHTLLHARGGSFVSLTDPPEELRAAAASCHNVGTWPVLVGEQDD